jgi:hypothetical protein
MKTLIILLILSQSAFAQPISKYSWLAKLNKRAQPGGIVSDNYWYMAGKDTARVHFKNDTLYSRDTSFFKAK